MISPVHRRLSGRRLAVCTAFALAGLLVHSPAQADEGGTSLYLLGSGGPGTAIMPPVKGLFLANTLYHYSAGANAGERFPLGGSVVVDMDASVTANFGTMLWVPTTDFAGGTLALGATLPVGLVDIGVDAVVTGPAGGTGSAALDDDALVVGDPILNALLGWNAGDYHIQVGAMLNVPIGDYREDRLANLSFNRWALDSSVAVTWHNVETGWDVSGKVGVTFNGTNDYTDYDSGNDFHAELAVEKTFSETFSAGVQLYHFQQLTGDSGAGATLGPFKGQASGVGVTAAWNIKVADRPATLRLHAFTEFDVRNRLEGDSVFLDFSIPLVMVMPGSP